MEILYSLDEPFPQGIYKRTSALPLRYFDYPVYSWPWCKHRTKIFLPIVLAILAVFSVADSVLTNTWQMGAFMMALNCIPSGLCIVCGPALAALVRSRHLRYPLERRLIIASLVLAVAIGMFAGRIVFAVWFDDAQAWVAAAKIPTPALENHPILFYLIQGTMALVFLMWFAGVFALREHANEHRFWREYLQKHESDVLRQQRDEAWDPLESTCRHASLSIL